MIAADTSVWVAALRGGHPPLARHLGVLLDKGAVLLPIPVRLELLAGAGTATQSQLARTLSALPLAIPGDATWPRMGTWCRRAASAGHRFGFTDLLIAALAVEAGARLWSLDHAFTRMAKLGLLNCYTPPDV